MPKRVSMTDIARLAGVSKNAVSLAFRKDPSIPAATRERIRAIAEAEGYVTNATVAELMTRLRRSREGRYRETLGLIHAHPDSEAPQTHPTIPHYLKGIRAQAHFQGYHLDEFFLHDPKVRGPALLRICWSRGIRGLLIVGLMDANRLPAHFMEVAKALACVVTGVRTSGPALSFVCADHHALTHEAMHQALALGYRRPGLVIDPVIDALLDHRFTGGYRAAQRGLPAARSLPPHYERSHAATSPASFREWRGRHRPDVILTLYHTVHRWLREEGLSVPGEIGLIQLERRPDHPEYAGMEQHNDLVGSKAVDLLISMLRNDEIGVPAIPVATMIGATWHDGATVKPIKWKS